MIAERVFMSYANDMKIHCIRRNSVRTFTKNEIRCSCKSINIPSIIKRRNHSFRGSQIRPNIHIDDICDVYLHCINNSLSMESGCYNAGFENISICEIAELIKSKIDCNIHIEDK